MKIRGQAVVIPKFGQFPNLIDRQDFSVFEIVSLTPLVYPFLRPEEQHRRSGEDQVIIPAREGQREVDKHFARAAVPGGEDAA